MAGDLSLLQREVLQAPLVSDMTGLVVGVAGPPI